MRLSPLFFFHQLASLLSSFFFFFNDTATTEIYTLSLHDALPIYPISLCSVDLSPYAGEMKRSPRRRQYKFVLKTPPLATARSEEHTSELQSRSDLVCRLLLEKKKQNNIRTRSANSYNARINVKRC